MVADRENTFRVFALLAAVMASLYILSPFIPIILLAGVIAFALDPLVKKIRNSRWCGHYSCLYALTFGLFLAITIPFLTILSKFYEKILSLDLAGEGKKATLDRFNQSRGQLVEALNNFLSQFGSRTTLDVDTMIKDGIYQVFSSIIHASTYVVSQIPEILFSFAVFLVTLFLFMKHAAWMTHTFYSANLLRPRETDTVIKVLRETSYSAVFSSIITGVLQSTIVTLGAAAFLDVDNLLVFTVTFLCSFIPVIGAAPIAFVLAIYAGINVGSEAAIGLVAVGAVAGIADNITRVFLLKIVKDKLHPFWSLLAIIGGIIVLGLPGLFLGPVIVSATLQIVPMLLGKQKTTLDGPVRNFDRSKS